MLTIRGKHVAAKEASTLPIALKLLVIAVLQEGGKMAA
jgi:hypothetical protein